jgi:hypothetical protein
MVQFVEANTKTTVKHGDCKKIIASRKHARGYKRSMPCATIDIPLVVLLQVQVFVIHGTFKLFNKKLFS